MNTTKFLVAAALAGSAFAAQAADFTIPEAPVSNVQLTRAQVKQETLQARAQHKLVVSEVAQPDAVIVASGTTRAQVKAEAVAAAKVHGPVSVFEIN